MYRIPMFLGIEHCSHYLCIFFCLFENLITVVNQSHSFGLRPVKLCCCCFFQFRGKNVRFISTRRPKQTNKTGDSLHWTKAPVLFRPPITHGFWIDISNQEPAIKISIHSSPEPSKQPSKLCHFVFETAAFTSIISFCVQPNRLFASYLSTALSCRAELIFHHFSEINACRKWLVKKAECYCASSFTPQLLCISHKQGIYHGFFFYSLYEKPGEIASNYEKILTEQIRFRIGEEWHYFSIPCEITVAAFSP